MRSRRGRIGDGMAKKGRERWSQILPDPALDEFVDAAIGGFWRAIALPASVVLTLVVVILLEDYVSQAARGLIVIAVGLVMSLRLWLAHRRLKAIAGRALEVPPEATRRLDVMSPELLIASLDRIRRRDRRS